MSSTFMALSPPVPSPVPPPEANLKCISSTETRSAFADSLFTYHDKMQFSKMSNMGFSGVPNATIS